MASETALVVVDVQNIMFEEPRCGLYRGDESVLAEDGHSTYDKPMASAATIVALFNDVLIRRFCRVMPAAEITF
ncbi:hypothetical protein [Pseudodesulfovibrio sp.]|uniref:hypothetical protein n=1 Tax=Pseudodesulfovibrio sp. TaxID=2035812 RepID=UPI00262A1041|nr:hypothetical protein [Pseudodesulfovibrio sp.]MDD3312346.1 hypothetical protein [Pseudodesulfovibrio sp.]